MHPEMTRRTVLRIGLATGSAWALAACKPDASTPRGSDMQALNTAAATLRTTPHRFTAGYGGVDYFAPSVHGAYDPLHGCAVTKQYPSAPTRIFTTMLNVSGALYIGLDHQYP